MSYLYAIQMLIPAYPNPIKIGYSTTVRQRMLAHSCGPFPIERLGSWPGTKEDERAIHRQFADHRLTGEWFYPTEELLKLIEDKGAKRGRQIRRSRPQAEKHKETVRKVNFGARRRATIDGVVQDANQVLIQTDTPYLTALQAGILLSANSKTIRGFSRHREIETTIDGNFLPEHIAEFLEAHPQYTDSLGERPSKGEEGYVDMVASVIRSSQLGCFE